MKFTPTFIEHPVYLPLKLIRQSISERWENTLGYYCLIKKLHTKPIIYNFSLRKLSALIGCSPTTLSHHIEIMSQNGLITLRDGNLTLIGTRKLNEEVNSILIPVRVGKNKSEQVTFLRHSLITRNLNIQHSLYTKKTAILSIQRSNCPLELKRIKKLIKLRNSQFPTLTEKSVCDKLILSNKKFGKLCNRSTSTGSRIQKKLNDLNLIQSHKNIELYSATPVNKPGFYSLCLSSKYFLSKKGLIYSRCANSIVLSPY